MDRKSRIELRICSPLDLVRMHPLDNVIWNALATAQSHLAESRGHAKKFPREVSLLGGISEPNREAYDSLASLLDSGERVGLFLEESPQPPSGWDVVSSVPLLQMVEESPTSVGVGPTESLFVQLGENDVPEMVGLTELTKPGPFGKRTREMGDYFGIHQAGKLVAMAGERLHVPGHTEISAVCTHPEHLGRGYATALIALLRDRVRQRGEKSFLHVRPDNTRAVELYEHLGFRKRALLQYALFTKQTNTPRIFADPHR